MLTVAQEVLLDRIAKASSDHYQKVSRSSLVREVIDAYLDSDASRVVYMVHDQHWRLWNEVYGEQAPKFHRLTCHVIRGSKGGYRSLLRSEWLNQGDDLACLVCKP